MHGHQKGGRGSHRPPWILKFLARGCFLNFEWEKSNFIIFGHMWKIFFKSPRGPSWKKNPSDAHGGTILLSKLQKTHMNDLL